MTGIGRFCCKEGKKNEFYADICLYIVMLVFGAGSLWWILNGNFFAQNDSRYVLECMARIREGDFSDLLPQGYIGAYTQHLGLMTIFQCIFTLTGTTDNFVIQIVNILCALCIIYAGYHILKELSRKLTVRIYYCVFMLFCFPLFFYVPYVYGEIISTTAGMVFIWAAICFVKRSKIGAWIAMGISSVVGNMARGNFPVLLVAFVIMAGLYTIHRKKWRYVICALSLFLIVMCSSALNTRYYEHISGIKLDQGVPMECWIAMGMDEYSIGCGVYNGLNISMYAESGYNRAAARKAANNYIHDRLSMFIRGAGRSAASFYKEKILIQWNDPTVNCFMENRSFIPDPHPLIWNITDPDTGKYAYVVREIMNQYQWLLYLGVLFCCLFLFKKQVPFYSLLTLIILVGGFFFTMIWETQSRYVFPYIIYMVPLAAAGWYWVQESFCHCFKSIKNFLCESCKSCKFWGK